MTIERTQAYRDRASRNYSSDGAFQYVLGNQALDEVRMGALRGDEPSEHTIEGIRYRLDTAAALSAERDPFRAYRSQLLSAYVVPIIFADVINFGLGNSGAKRVGERLGLRQSHTDALNIAKHILEDYDSLNASSIKMQNEPVGQTLAPLIGVLNELTAIELVNRHPTGKLFAVPTTTFDDEMSVSHENADGIIYDQRRRGILKRKNPFQVKSNRSYNRYSIPVINEYDMANQYKASQWPYDDERFTTLRMLVSEGDGESLSPRSQSTLDRLSNFVIRKALT